MRWSCLSQYLNDSIPIMSLHYTTRFFYFCQILKLEPNFFRNIFFQYTVNEWNNLGNIIKPFESYLTFRKILFNLIRPKCNETYRIHHTTGLKLLTRLRLGLSHLNDHKFNHSFRDCINPLCLCSVKC